MVVGLLPMQSLPITTYVVSSNPAQAEVYSIQHYVILSVTSDRQVVSLDTRFPPPIKLISC